MTCQRSLKNLVRECVSKCKLCQAENERLKSDCLSMKREFVYPETLKTNFYKPVKWLESVEPRNSVKPPEPKLSKY